MDDITSRQDAKKAVEDFLKDKDVSTYKDGNTYRIRGIYTKQRRVFIKYRDSQLYTKLDAIDY